jgi:hypothetical protein
LLGDVWLPDAQFLDILTAREPALCDGCAAKDQQLSVAHATLDAAIQERDEARSVIAGLTQNVAALEAELQAARRKLDAARADAIQASEAYANAVHILDKRNAELREARAEIERLKAARTQKPPSAEALQRLWNDINDPDCCDYCGQRATHEDGCVGEEIATARAEIARLTQLVSLHEAHIDDQTAEIARLNAMRTHCPDCGGDYMATGVEVGCPCKLRAEVERLKEDRDMARGAMGNMANDVVTWACSHDPTFTGDMGFALWAEQVIDPLIKVGRAIRRLEEWVNARGCRCAEIAVDDDTWEVNLTEWTLADPEYRPIVATAESDTFPAAVDAALEARQ